MTSGINISSKYDSFKAVDFTDNGSNCAAVSFKVLLTMYVTHHSL